MSVIDQWDVDRWDFIRFLLGFLLAICALSVWRGAVLEESTYEWTKSRGRRLQRAGHAWTFTLAIFLLVIDTAVSIHQKHEIADANRTTELLKAHNAELTRALAPRDLEMTSFIRILKPYQDTKVIFASVSDFEARRTAARMIDIFYSASWSVLTPQPRINDNIRDGIVINVLNGLVSRDPLQFTDDHDREIANVICQHLKDVNIDASVDLFPPTAHLTPLDLRDPSDPSDAVVIGVGFKPSTYFEEELNPTLKRDMDRMREAERRVNQPSIPVASRVCL